MFVLRLPFSGWYTKINSTILEGGSEEAATIFDGFKRSAHKDRLTSCLCVCVVDEALSKPLASKAMNCASPYEHAGTPSCSACTQMMLKLCLHVSLFACDEWVVTPLQG